MKKPGLRFRLWWNKKLESIPFWPIVIFWAIVAAITFFSLLWTLAAIGNILKHEREHIHNV